MIKAPKHLASPEADLWKTLIDDYGISDSGGQAILLAELEAHSRARMCRELIDRDGLLVEGKPHPLLLCERDSRKLFLSALRQLDLDVEEAAAVGNQTPVMRRVR